MPLILTSGRDDDPAAASATLLRAWEQGQIVGLASLEEQGALQQALGPTGPEGWGAGVVIGSGGSSGQRRWCLQPLGYLQASAAATGRWLQGQGIDPYRCLHLNPLPLHHVSGLLPLVRCQSWGADLGWLPPPLMREPATLAAARPHRRERPVLLSLVPTQLLRLMADPAGLAWLQGCRLIWVGGAPLAPADAARARQAQLPLARCYGATETAAMVCAQPPEEFLAGGDGCGQPLDDVQLRLALPHQALEVRSTRLSPGWLERGQLHSLPLEPGGWWRSGDGAQLGAEGLSLLGRLDGALHSGGETVFPEVLEARLTAQAEAMGLPLQHLLLLAEPDPLWGERLVALVRAAPGSTATNLLPALEALVRTWPAAERPRRWLACPTLAPTGTGKWERQRWRQWLRGAAPQRPGPTPPASGQSPRAGDSGGG